MTVALYPGSFDPVHNGHLAIIGAATRLFDKVIVAVGHNPGKASGMFDGPTRAKLLTESVADIDRGRGVVEVALFTGLVTTAAADLGADCLLKGVRSVSDLDAEMLQANMNAATSDPPGLPTVFLPGIGDAALISSRYIREIASRGGDVGLVVPPNVVDGLKSHLAAGTNRKSDGS